MSQHNPPSPPPPAQQRQQQRESRNHTSSSPLVTLDGSASPPPLAQTPSGQMKMTFNLVFMPCAARRVGYKPWLLSWPPRSAVLSASSAWCYQTRPPHWLPLHATATTIYTDRSVQARQAGLATIPYTTGQQSWRRVEGGTGRQYSTQKTKNPTRLVELETIS